ncbi:MAG TPA: SPFH domain-containing protein [Conexivisphaerales archaeon]|nr:SPFH domain-containing protein [Conexivisphaerales archaeon]
MPQVIEWPSPGENDIVWRYPIEDITWGAQLVVKEFEAAVFLRDGKAYDVFNAGRHTLTTQNLPLLTSILSRIAGYNQTPFKATVIYVGLKQFQGLFGLQAQSSELAPLQARGKYYLRVSDPNLFVNEIVGGQSAYTSDQVSEYLRGFVNERIIGDLSHYDLATVYTQLDDTSFKVKTSIGDTFKRAGLELIDLKFEAIDTPPEWRDRIYYIKQGVSASETLRMQTASKVAEDLGKSQGGGAAIGTGAVILPQMFNQQGAAAGMTMVICPNCKTQVPANSKFCPNCGFDFTKSSAPSAPPTAPPSPPAGPSDGAFCTTCGKPLKPGAKFCGSCGASV